MAGPVREEGADALLAVRVTPRARANALQGLVEDADGHILLAVRLAAPPVDGAANKALTVFLAKAASLPKSSVSVVSGETGRRKTLRFTGISAQELSRRLGTGSP